MKTTLSLFCTLSLLTSSTGTAAAGPKAKPNLVVILADDLGYNDLGCFGSAQIHTPHLDRMARAGLRLTSFYAQPLCGPSRAALMTGCYPMRVAEPGNRKHNHTVPHSKELTLAEVLKPSEARSPHEAFFYYNYTHLQAVRSGRWKLVLPRPEHAPWTGFARRMHNDGVKETELYDLRADRGETKNVAAQYPDEVQRLLKLIDKGRADLGDYDRVGAGQRFFDDGPKRPDRDDWKKK